MFPKDVNATAPTKVDASPRFKRRFVAALATSLLALGTTGALAVPGHEHGHAPGHANVSENPSAVAAHRASQARAWERSQRIERGRQASNALLGSLKAYERASQKERGRAGAVLAERAAQRMQAMVELLDQEPGEALALSLPTELRNRLPEAARAHVEETVDASGVVVGMLIDDPTRNEHRHELYLEIEDGAGKRQYGLHAANRSADDPKMMALIDRKVRMRALRIDQHLVVADADEIEFAQAPKNGKGNAKTKSTTDAAASTTTKTTSTTLSTTTTSTPAVNGDQRTLVILGSFQDKAVTCTASDVNNRMFGSTSSANAILRQSSNNAVSVSGNVVGPFTIPYSATSTCDYRAWGTALDNAAKAAGVDLSQYRRLSYSMPSNSNCGFAGIANLGGSTQTRSWVMSCGTTGLYAHELSHNLRFHHASTPSAEYGDNSDPMGQSKTVLMNAPNRVMAGWLPAHNVIDASNSGSFDLATLSSTDTGAAKVVRVRKPDTNEFYFVSLRQSEGLDTNLASTYKNLVTVHRTTGVMPAKTVLVARLAAGQVFSDTTNSIKLTANAVGLTSANLTLQLGTAVATCTPATPTVSVSPSSQTGEPGSRLVYTLTVKNNNSAACASTNFVMSQTGPAGFSGAFSASSVSLASGASATITWTAASATTTADGTYRITANAAQSGVTAGSATATYVVYQPVVASTVAIVSPADGARIKAAPMNLSASVSGKAAISKLEFFVNGALAGYVTAEPYTVRWHPRTLRGQATVVARATTAEGTKLEDTISFTLY